MRVPSCIFWGFVAILLLVTVGIIVYASVVLANNVSSSSPIFVPTVLLLTLGVLALIAWIALFAAYTVQTRGTGNWYDSIVDKGRAARQRAQELVAEKRAELAKARLNAQEARLRLRARNQGGIYLSEQEASSLLRRASQAEQQATRNLQEAEQAAQQVEQQAAQQQNLSSVRAIDTSRAALPRSLVE